MRGRGEGRGRGGGGRGRGIGGVERCGGGDGGVADDDTRSDGFEGVEFFPKFGGVWALCGGGSGEGIWGEERKERKEER